MRTFQSLLTLLVLAFLLAVSGCSSKSKGGNSDAGGDGGDGGDDASDDAGNHAPTASAGADSVSLVDRVVTLNGAGEDDDGDSLTYAWTQTDGPSVTLDDDTSATPSFGVRQVGVYIFSLVVSDGANDSVADDVVVAVHDINGGENFSVALKPDGSLWAWGHDGDGRLGNGTAVDDSDVPTRVCAPGEIDCATHPFTGAVAIAVGRAHALALKADGTVWAWGFGYTGELGNNDDGNFASTPVQVCAVGETDCDAHPLTNVVSIAAGYQHSEALLADGTVVAWGRNYDGECGNGESELGTGILTPQQVCAVGATAPCSTANSNVLTGVVTLAAGGGGHSLALDEDGNVYAWGYNKSGQVGIGDSDENRVPIPHPVCAAGEEAPCENFLTDIVDIDAWSGHSLALDATGALWGWGGNDEGELSMLTTDECYSGSLCTEVPRQVCTTYDDPCTTPLTGVRSFQAGRRFSVALLDDATVRTWGDNSVGELGVGNTDAQTTEINVCDVGETAPCATHLVEIAAVSAGNFQVFALGQDGTLYTWGQNSYGELGIDTISDFEAVPQEVTAY